MHTPRHNIRTPRFLLAASENTGFEDKTVICQPGSDYSLAAFSWNTLEGHTRERLHGSRELMTQSLTFHRDLDPNLLRQSSILFCGMHTSTCDGWHFIFTLKVSE